MGPGEMSKRYKAAEHSDGLQSCKVLVVSRSSDALQDFADLYRSLLGQTFQAWKWLICCSGVEEQPLNPAFLQAVAEDKRVLIKGGADCTVANEIWASPEYIVLADAAIEFDPTFIEKGIWCLESNPEFAFCNSFGVVPGVGGGRNTAELE